MEPQNSGTTNSAQATRTTSERMIGLESMGGVIGGLFCFRYSVAPNVHAVPTAGAAVSVETGGRVKVTERMDGIAAMAAGSSALFAICLRCWLLILDDLD
jgi:hypothetical protein